MPHGNSQTKLCTKCSAENSINAIWCVNTACRETLPLISSPPRVYPIMVAAQPVSQNVGFLIPPSCSSESSSIKNESNFDNAVVNAADRHCGPPRKG